MAIAYLNLTELKTERADTAKVLRWVESQLSWYNSDPTSTATANDDSVVAPNIGNGRWLKQNSTNSTANGLTYQLIAPANGIPTQGLTSFVATGTSVAAAATYSNVIAETVTGLGSGLTLNITKTGAGTVYAGAIAITIVSSAGGYVVGDTVKVLGTSLGGATPANDLSLTIGGVVQSSFNAALGNAYFVDNSAGIATKSTLPATALPGQAIGFGLVSTSSPIRKIIIGRNGRSITGDATDKAITAQQDYAELVYVSDAIGWTVRTQSSKVNNLNVLKTNTNAVNLPYSGTLGQLLGIVDYLGKNLGTTTYQNPTSTANSRTQRLWGGCIAASATGITANLPELYNKILSTARLVSASDFVSPVFVFDFGINTLIRLDAIEITLGTTIANYFPTELALYGSNNYLRGNANNLITSQISVSPGVRIPYNQLFTGIESIAYLSDINGDGVSTGWMQTGSSNTGFTQKIFNLNSPKFYRYLLLSFPSNFSGGAGLNNAYLNQLEFYGDVIAS